MKNANKVAVANAEVSYADLMKLIAEQNERINTLTALMQNASAQALAPTSKAAPKAKAPKAKAEPKPERTDLPLKAELDALLEKLEKAYPSDKFAEDIKARAYRSTRKYLRKYADEALTVMRQGGCKGVAPSVASAKADRLIEVVSKLTELAAVKAKDRKARAAEVRSNMYSLRHCISACSPTCERDMAAAALKRNED